MKKNLLFLFAFMLGMLTVKAQKPIYEPSPETRDSFIAEFERLRSVQKKKSPEFVTPIKLDVTSSELFQKSTQLVPVFVMGFRVVSFSRHEIIKNQKRYSKLWAFKSVAIVASGKIELYVHKFCQQYPGECVVQYRGIRNITDKSMPDLYLELMPNIELKKTQKEVL